MKFLLCTALLGLQLSIAHAQAPAYHWEINGVPVQGATSVCFVMAQSQNDSGLKYEAARERPVSNEHLAYAGRMLRTYKICHFTGSSLEMGGAAIITINLLEMNRTGLPKSNYTPFYVIGGGLALAGYVINSWIAPGLVARAGIALKGNTLSVDLP